MSLGRALGGQLVLEKLAQAKSSLLVPEPGEGVNV